MCFHSPVQARLRRDLEAQRQLGLPSTALHASVFIRAHPGNPWFLPYDSAVNDFSASTSRDHFLKSSLWLPVRSRNKLSDSSRYMSSQSGSRWQSREPCQGPIKAWSRYLDSNGLPETKTITTSFNFSKSLPCFLSFLRSRRNLLVS
jgi:hypothetical protein